jgi:hypothetical protein
MASFIYFILFYFTVSFGFLSRMLEKFSILISTSDRYGTSHRRHKKDIHNLQPSRDAVGN